ncbi:hypothetical protein UFOVP1336_49 [uncultured Caudovirales phage]|uniref:Uncharacterized protein n=1 Tax=uncultured Caudovirales phage TaxID=2100421 RepID=A0A6J5RYK3_9CAUD|nr:hypothetical protein UFOVP1336_49 [uncultured Caudovirales phage]
MSKTQRNWMRVDRDWDSSTKIRRIGMEFGANGVVAWFSLLARACQNDGVIGDDMDLRVAICSPAVSLTQNEMDVIADGFKSLGVVEMVDGSWNVANWSQYQPPMNAITPKSRNRHEIVTDKRDDNSNVVTDKSGISVATNERTNEQTDKQTSRVIRGETPGRYRSTESVARVLGRLGS